MNTQRLRRTSREGGFTLIEIMVVIVIIGLLATIVAPNLLNLSDEAKIEKARVDVKIIADQVKIYLMRSSSRDLPSLETLTTPDQKGKVWIENMSLDPWNNDYEIREGDVREGVRFEVISAGPNGMMGDEDDISSHTQKDKR